MFADMYWVAGIAQKAMDNVGPKRVPKWLKTRTKCQDA